MVFVVYQNDIGGRDLTTLEQIDEFVTNELIPRLDIPANYRGIFDGTTLYLGVGCGVTLIGTPFPKKSM